MRHTWRLHLPLMMAMWATSTAMPAAPPAAPVAMGQPASSQAAKIAPEDDLPSPVLDPQARRRIDLEVIERFLAHVQQSDAFSPAAREAIAAAWSDRKNDENIRPFMSAAVAIGSEPYQAALNALDAQDHAKVESLLTPLLAGPDDYIARHAAALLAQSFVEQDRLEGAQPLLEGMYSKKRELATHTFLAPQAMFLLGYCRVANLQYDAGRQVLEEFERAFPDAPEPYRLPARQILQELAGRQPESLGEVSDLMVYAGRELGHGHTDEAVRARQTRAVELLDRLIDQTEKQEQQQNQQAGGQSGDKQNSGGSATPSQGTPRRGADRSTLPGGPSRTGSLNPAARVRPGEQWGKLRPEERERVLQSLRQSFPSRYRQLVEQYYKQLAKEQ